MEQSRTILLVEDNENDALLLQMALAEILPSSHLEIVPDALSAMYYLNGVGSYADRKIHPLPYLVICDLVLPGISGLKLIEWIRRDKKLKHLLLIALTGALHAADYASVYQAGADTFMHKSPDKSETMDTLSGIFQFWIRQKIIPSDYTPERKGKKRKTGSNTADFPPPGNG